MKLTLKTINYMNLFENVTGARVKDCIEEDGKLIFLVEEGNVKLAVRNLKRVSGLLKKEIKIIGFSSDPVKFIKNLLYPIKPDGVMRRGNTVVIKVANNAVKGKIFGRSKENFKRIEGLMKKYFKDMSLVVE